MLKKSALILLFTLSACTSALTPLPLPVNERIASVVKNTSSTFFPIDPDFVWQYDVVFHPEDDPYIDYKRT